MTLRELINQVTENSALDQYLLAFQVLDFEVKINDSYDEEKDFTINKDSFRKQITLETY